MKWEAYGVRECMQEDCTWRREFMKEEVYEGESV